MSPFYISHAMAKYFCLIFLCGFSSVVLAQSSPMPKLLPLTAADLPQGCSCQFGRNAGEPLLAWSTEAPSTGVVRDASGLHPLKLYAEKYLPEKRARAQRGDHLAVMFSDGAWHVQAVGEAIEVCSARARQCTATGYRSHLVLQWQGRERAQLEGWGRCSC